jgi:hypothetical protein
MELSGICFSSFSKIEIFSTLNYFGGLLKVSLVFSPSSCSCGPVPLFSSLLLPVSYSFAFIDDVSTLFLCVVEQFLPFSSLLPQAEYSSFMITAALLLLSIFTTLNVTVLH